MDFSILSTMLLLGMVSLLISYIAFVLNAKLNNLEASTNRINYESNSKYTKDLINIIKNNYEIDIKLLSSNDKELLSKRLANDLILLMNKETYHYYETITKDAYLYLLKLCQNSINN